MNGEGNGTVLVVEDQPDLARAYTEILSTQYSVRKALGGEEALEMADNEVDVVLLDRRMPGMSGDEVLANLVERGISVKVAMLTAVEPDVDIVDLPFDDYKIKPVNNDELIGLIEVLMRRAEYDNTSQQFFRLAAKKKTLESAGKDDTEAYQQLNEQLQDLRDDVDETLEELSHDAAIGGLDI